MVAGAVPLIQVRGLTKFYRMGAALVRALDGVDLDVARGEFVAITGPSGSGKSTLMHLIGCLDRPSSGQCILNGRDVSALGDRELAAIRNKQIGFVFQTFNLINRTSALENVGMPLFYARKGTTRAPACRALERVGLATRARHRPNELSGGERQRVAIARALVNEPLLLLADEPTGNLDTRTGQQIMALFRELNEQGVTILLVTHERDVAVQARRIVRMRDGKIISDRPADQALRDELPAATARDAPAPPPAACPASGSPRPAAPARPAKPRMAQGAVGALVCGIVALALALGGWGGGRLLATVYPLSASGPRGGLPSPALLLVSAAIVLGILAAIGLGIVSIAWGWRVLRRIRAEPGHWAGRQHARRAMALGAAAIIIPLALSTLWRALS